MEFENKIITIKSTRFIFPTNFKGEPDPTYGNRAKIANIVVPPSMVPELEAAGINVKSYPREPEEGQQLTYFIKTEAKWRNKYGELRPDRYLPHIRTYEGRNSKPVELDEESAGMIDDRLSSIEEISVKINPWQNQNGGISLSIQDLSILFSPNGDPFGDMYGCQDEEDIPFN